MKTAALRAVTEKIGSGSTPRGGEDSYPESGTPFIRSLNVYDEGFREDGLAFLTAQQADALSSVTVESGDVLLNITGASVARCCLAPDRLLPARVNQHVCIIRPTKASLDSHYLQHLLVSGPTKRRLLRIGESGGATRQAITKADLQSLEIPLPPLPEQKRIAAILDAADALRAKRRESIEQLDSLIQATFLEMFGLRDRPPISIGPPTFGAADKFVTLGDIARLATGHTPDRSVPEYWDGNTPWISLTDIRGLDGAVAQSTQQSITEAGLANSSAVRLPPGTVCFSRTASIGFVTVMGREMATSQDFVNWVCGPSISPVYLMMALRLSRPYLLEKSTGSTHKTIYYRSAEQFQVHLPPIEEQQLFASIVESIEQQKARLKAHLAELDTLFASLQSRAFNGELVA